MDSALVTFLISVGIMFLVFTRVRRKLKEAAEQAKNQAKNQAAQRAGQKEKPRTLEALLEQIAAARAEQEQTSENQKAARAAALSDARLALSQRRTDAELERSMRSAESFPGAEASSQPMEYILQSAERQKAILDRYAETLDDEDFEDFDAKPEARTTHSFIKTSERRPVAKVQKKTNTRAKGVRGALRNPESLRNAFVIKEILDRKA